MFGHPVDIISGGVLKYIDLGSCLRRAARRWGSQICATCDDSNLSFDGLYDRSLRLASALRSAGLKQHDRVGILLRNRLEYLEVLFATSLAGLVVVPINRRLSAAEIDYIARDAGLRLLVTEPMFEQAVASLGDAPVQTVVVDGSATSSYETLVATGSSSFVPVEVEDDEAMQSIHYTSGTTANPKGVVHSHASTYAMSAGVRSRFQVQPGETWLLAVPAHSAGFYAMGSAPMLGGARLLMAHEFAAAEMLSLLETEKVVGGLLVPTMWELLLGVPGAADVKLPSLRYPLWGGMPMRSGTAARLEVWLPKPCLGSYGLTEAPCLSYATVDTYASGRTDSSGFPIETMEIRIIDDDGADMPRGEYGELLIRGSELMSGYFHRPELTASAMTDGWLRTGDWGRIDDDGALAVVDRKKDMIISGGENIYPAELEDSLSTMPGVRETAIVGLPDETWGQTVCAVIVASDESVTEATVIDWCVQNHAKYKCPRRIVFADELPKNALGKVVKPMIIESIVSSNRIGGLIDRHHDVVGADRDIAEAGT